MRYFEIGLGNRWFMSTELSDESRVKGYVLDKVHAWYIRVWIGRVVYILDSKKIKRKLVGGSTGLPPTF